MTSSRFGVYLFLLSHIGEQGESTRVSWWCLAMLRSGISSESPLGVVTRLQSYSGAQSSEEVPRLAVQERQLATKVAHWKHPLLGQFIH